MTDNEAWLEEQLAIAIGLLYQSRRWVPENLKDQIDLALSRRRRPAGKH